MQRTLLRFAPALSLLPVLVAQDATPTAPLAPVPTGFPTPILEQPGDEGRPGGIWAAGADYKASFHDGFAFYPVLGPGHERNLPLAFRGTEVLVGASRLNVRERASARVAAPHRCEYDLGNGVVEAYDVRADGVEQTFVLAQRPHGSGDLVVVLQVATGLAAPRLVDEHATVEFRDAAGQPILRYGAATAIDAAGERLPMTTTWTGSALRLRLDAERLAAAAFPLVVDPLTTTVPFDAGGPGAGALGEIALGRDTTAALRRRFVAFSRASSATDHDLFAVLADDGNGNQLAVYADLTTSWSTQHPQVAFVGATDRWLLAFDRDFGTNTAVRLVGVPAAATAPVTQWVTVPAPIGYPSTRLPDLGGTLATDRNQTVALLVYQADDVPNGGDSLHTEVFSVPVDTSGVLPQVGTARVVGSPVGTRYDRHRPAINRQRSDAETAWIVTYQQFDRQNAGSLWKGAVYRVGENGAFHGPSVVPVTSQHVLQPRIDGLDGRYLIAYARRSGAGTATLAVDGDIECVRVDWVQGRTSATFGPRRDVAISSSSVHEAVDVAIDTDSLSHWAIVFERRFAFARDSLGIARVGGSGGLVEEATLYASSTRPAYSPALCFDDDGDEFDAVFAVETPTPGIYARSLEYPNDAVAVGYGTGCGGTIAANHAPRAGDHLFAITLSGARPQQGAFLAFSLARGQLPLDPFGMAGCTLLVGTDVGSLLGTWFTITRTNGTASMPILLPDWPVRTMDFTAQWFWLDPQANVAGLRATRGLDVQVR